jgi:outer membrane protein assembly factor BamD
MRAFARYGTFLLILAGMWGCGEKGAKLQKSVVPPDKSLFETGSEYLKKSQYIKARLAFQTLINTYPDSEMAADSYLAIADSFYDESGVENLLQAEDQYKNFIIFFPTNPKTVDAQMKIISLNMKMMRSPDRDKTYSYRAESAIQKFLSDYPESEYAPVARQYLREVQENLAQGDYGVGMFYSTKGNHIAAKSRFKEITDSYKEFSLMDEALFHLGESLEKTENPDEAAIYYGKIASEYPFSPRFDQAKERLQAMGKAIPEVNTQLAAENQARVKPPEGFSPLKPFVDFASALGIKGTPDRYETARKTVEAQKTASAATAAAQGERTSDGILIETTITKDASGKTTDSTTLAGVNANAGQAATDKNEDKKNQDPKDTKKKKKDEKKPS